MIKLEIGQVWRSKTHPHEDFKIYDGIEDSIVLSDMEIYETLPFEKLPETAKIYFWERVNDNAFDEFVKSKKGEDYENTYPYAWSGECKKQVLVNKIKKYNMELH